MYFHIFVCAVLVILPEITKVIAVPVSEYITGVVAFSFDKVLTSEMSLASPWVSVTTTSCLSVTVDMDMPNNYQVRPKLYVSLLYGITINNAIDAYVVVNSTIVSFWDMMLSEMIYQSDVPSGIYRIVTTVKGPDIHNVTILAVNMTSGGCGKSKIEKNESMFGLISTWSGIESAPPTLGIFLVGSPWTVGEWLITFMYNMK